MVVHSQTEVAKSGVQQGHVTIAFMVIAWFFILLRIWTRTYIISNFGWDDAAMILAGMVFTTFCAAQLYIAANGLGTHVTSFELQQQLTTFVLISEASYILSMMTIKISVCLYFARIMVKRAHFILIYVTVGINIVSSLTAFFHCLFRCGPNLSMYMLKQLTDHCAHTSIDLFMAYQQGTFNALTDIVYISLPVLILWNAQMDLRSKLSVGFVLSLAALGCICSIIRFPFIDGLVKTQDFFWNVVNISIWSTVEAGACITAGCIATLRPLIKCAVHLASGSNALSSSNTIPPSESRRSTQLSHLHKSEHGRVTPHYDIVLAEIDGVCCSSKIKRLGVHCSCELMGSLSLAPTGDEATLSSDIGNKRTSMEPILGRNDLVVPEFGGQFGSKEGIEKETEANQGRSARGSWSFRKDMVVGTVSTHPRPTSAPASPDCYGQV